MSIKRTKQMISLLVGLEPLLRIWVLGTFTFYKYMKFTGYFDKRFED